MNAEKRGSEKPFKVFLIRVHLRYPRLSLLVTECITNVFDCVPNFPSNLAEAFLNISPGFVRATFGFEIAVVNGSANTFLGFALHLIEFSFDFISIR
jgi:hypothetical protein